MYGQTTLQSSMLTGQITSLTQWRVTRNVLKFGHLNLTGTTSTVNQNEDLSAKSSKVRLLRTTLLTLAKLNEFEKDRSNNYFEYNISFCYH